MTWPFAVFAIFSVLFISSLLFLLVIYLKEYAREEKLVEQLTKAQLKLEKEFGNMPIYILPAEPPAPKKKKTAAPETDLPKLGKTKKDYN
jgi:hypothetical protein